MACLTSDIGGSCGHSVMSDCPDQNPQHGVLYGLVSKSLVLFSAMKYVHVIMLCKTASFCLTSDIKFLYIKYV